jgi:glycosyltransferase involved in cell wall biosynthesis
MSNRLLLIVTGLNRGGAEMQVFHLASGLCARGWEVKVVSLLSGGAMTDQFREAGIQVHELAVQRGIPDPRAILGLRKIIQDFRPDVVHSHMVHANLLARVTRLIFSMPALISTAHNMTEGRRWTEIAYRVTDSIGDLTTIICKAAAERYVKVGSVPLERLKVVVNGLPVEQFRPDPTSRAAMRRQLGIEGEFVWLAVGRFEPPKDYANLINAFAQVRSDRSVLLIAGDGPLRPDMEKLASELNISLGVRFLGVRKDIPALMSAADGYVMSSAWEGLPMVLLEAAASGLPIVATNVGGNGEVVRDGISGYLVPPSDSNALALTLQQVEQTPRLARITMGLAGRDFVVTNYSISSVLDEWESIYRAFIHKAPQLEYAQAASS